MTTKTDPALTHKGERFYRPVHGGYPDVKKSALQLQSGRWYLRRDGRIVGPLLYRPTQANYVDALQPWVVLTGNEVTGRYYGDGHWNIHREPMPEDIVDEAWPPPTRSLPQ